MGRITSNTIRKMKLNGEKITMLTAYDYGTALILDEAGIDIILVGDSLGNVVLGYDDTTKVTMEDMIHHTKAVTRAAKNCLVVADMPFLSYNTGARDAVINAGRLIREGGANMIKLEGGVEIIEEVSAIIKAGIPVMGHLGLQPQSVHKYGGFFIQGRNEKDADKILNDALTLQKAGVSSIVLECVPKSLAEKITKSLEIPTIGIGAGDKCDGQVLVIHDILGLYHKKPAKFVKQYASVADIISKAASDYISEVKDGTHPDAEHSFE